jgi:hypothetical protein
MALKRKSISQRDLLYLSLSALVLTVAWISFNIYHIWATSTITEDLQMQIQPITPDFDTGTITALKSRKKITPVYTSNNPPAVPVGAKNIQPNVTPTPTIEPITLNESVQPDQAQPVQVNLPITGSNSAQPAPVIQGVQGQ